MKVLLKYGCFFRPDGTGKMKLYEQGSILFVTEKEAKALDNKIVILEPDAEVQTAIPATKSEGAPVAPVQPPAPAKEKTTAVNQEPPPAIVPIVSIPAIPDKASNTGTIKLEILAPPPAAPPPPAPVVKPPEKKKAPVKLEPVPILPKQEHEAHVPEASSAVMKAANAPIGKSKVQVKAEKAVKTVSKAAKAKTAVTKPVPAAPVAKESRFRRDGK